MEQTIRSLLDHMGEDPDREGLKRTPQRVAEALRFLTKGYAEDPIKVINDAIFTEDTNEMILVKHIDFYSLCEHHLLPFFGRAHVAYIPRGKIIGLSKIARIVEIYARRLQVQERMTLQIAHLLQEQLQPLGVGVVVEAQHLCMMMRGVEKQNSLATTSAMLGVFHDENPTRAEFLRLIGNGG